MKNKISVLAVDLNNPQILPLIKKLEPYIYKCYGCASPKQKKKVSVKNEVSLSVLPYILRRIINFFIDLKIFPQYYAYWCYMKTTDWVFSRKIAKDPSYLLYTNPIFSKTVERAKKAGKIVVVNAGNSEPEREYQRIIKEYQEFGIKHRYIYGDKRFKEACIKSYSMADYIVTISKVSMNTYVSSGYNINKLHLIPLTGTDFPISENDVNGKEKVFITTAFHNFIKGTHRLLLAWQRAQIKNVPLIVVGRICEDLQEFIEKYGPFDNVLFVGHQKDIASFYSTRDAVGILLSLSEGAGRVTPEMMSFGFPMITSSDATCDIVVDAYNGFIVDTTNEEQIIDKLRYFAEDWNRVYLMRNNVLNSVSSRTVKDYSIEIADFLYSLI